MLWTLVVGLVALWAVGVIQGFGTGGSIHLLLLAALGVMAVRLFAGGRSAVPRGSSSDDLTSDPVRPSDATATAADARRAWIESR